MSAGYCHPHFHTLYIGHPFPFHKLVLMPNEKKPHVLEVQVEEGFILVYAFPFNLLCVHFSLACESSR